MPNGERIELLISPEALKQFEQLKSVSEANTASFEKLIAKAVELNKAVGNATTFKEVNKATQEMTANEKALTKQVDDLAKANAKLQALYADEAKKIAEVKAQQQARNQAIKEEIQLNKAAEGSIERKRIQLKQLQREYDNLSAAEREAAQGKELLNSIAALDKELKGLEGSTGRFQRNVGNYGSALKTLEGYLADVRQQLAATKQAASGLTIGAPGPALRASSSPLRTGDNKQQLVAYNQAVAQSTERVAELTKQEQLLSRIVESQMAGFASATAEIKNNEKALQALGAAGLQNTEFYQTLLKDTAELKDNVGDLKDEIKALASDTRQFDLFAGAVTGLVNTIQVGASAAELFAGESEDLQKSIQRLIALQNISQGIQQIANDLTTRGTALNKLYNFIIGEGAKTQKAAAAATAVSTASTEANTVATEAATVATTGLATATKVLRAALILSGIGALIAGIIYLVTKIQEWRDADIELIKRQTELNQVTLESIRLNKELADLTRTDIGTYVQGMKNRIAANQAYGRSQGEILAAEQALLKARQEAATIKFFDTGGAGALARFETDLKNAAKALDDFNKEQAAIPVSDRNEKQADAQRALLQSTLDLTRENYSQQRAVVDDYYNFNNEVIAKQLQIERLASDERRKYALQTATLSANAVIEANERALQNESATLKQRLALMQSTAEQQKRIARAQNEDVQNDPSASANDRLLAARNLGYQINKIEKDSLEAQRKLREEYRKRELTALQEVFKIQLEDQIKANDLIANNEKKSFNQRTDALYAAYEKRRQLITANYEFELQQAIKNGAIAEERIALEEKALSEINQLTIEYGLQQQAIYQDNTDKVNEIIAKGQQGRLDKIAGDLAAANTELIQQLASGQITLEQFNKKRDDAERNARIISLKEEVNNATAKVLATKEGTAARFEAEKELREKTQALNEEYYAKEVAAITKLNELKKQLATESFETFTSLVNSQFDNESARIQQQIDELEKQKEKEIEVANATIANKQERELAIASIEAKAQAQREQLERRQRQIDLDRARFEKAANIAQIITSTAVAIINQLKVTPLPAGAPLAAAIGAIGALQLARAIAAPLPKFADGTTDAPGGLAWVGDGGKKELVITPQGQVMQTPAVPTVMNVPRHSIVLPDARAALESGLAVNRHGRLVQNEGSEIKEVGKKIDTLTKVMRNKPTLNMNADQGGLTAIWKYGANWVTYAEDQTRF
jgi:hypothetical protein